MDPTAAARYLTELLTCGDLSEAFEHSYDLTDWLHAGGFPPVPGDHTKACVAAVQSYLRDRTGEIVRIRSTDPQHASADWRSALRRLRLEITKEMQTLQPEPCITDDLPAHMVVSEEDGL